MKKFLMAVTCLIITSCEEQVDPNLLSKTCQSIADPYKMTVDGHLFIIFSRTYGGAAIAAVHHPDCKKCKMEASK